MATQKQCYAGDDTRYRVFLAQAFHFIYRTNQISRNVVARKKLSKRIIQTFPLKSKIRHVDRSKNL